MLGPLDDDPRARCRVRALLHRICILVINGYFKLV